MPDRTSARRLVTSPVDAEDVLAIAFFAWRRREAVRLVDGSILRWLLVTATYAAQNLRRSTRRYRALLGRLRPPEAAPDRADLLDAGAASAACGVSRPPTSEREAAAVLGSVRAP